MQRNNNIIQSISILTCILVTVAICAYYYGFERSESYYMMQKICITCPQTHYIECSCVLNNLTEHEKRLIEDSHRKRLRLKFIQLLFDQSSFDLYQIQDETTAEYELFVAELLEIIKTRTEIELQSKDIQVELKITP